MMTRFVGNMRPTLNSGLINVTFQANLLVDYTTGSKL